MSTTEPVGTLETTGAYPKYDEYEESGVEWLGEIPTHWETIRLNWAADYINGYMFSPDERGDEGLPIIRIAQLTGESSSFDRHDGSLDEKYKVEQGDLLFSWSATLDAFVWDQGPAWLNQHIFRVEPISKLDKKYLGYCLKAIIPVLVRDSHGSTMKHIKRQTLKDHSIGLPPLDEQRAIATFLDRETERIDVLIEKKERLIDLLEEKRTALISRVFTKGLDRDVEMQDSGVEWLGEIPEHWETASFKHVTDRVEVGIAEAATHAYADEGVPLIRSTNVKPNYLSTDDVLYIEEWFAEKNSSKYLKADDILTVRTGEPGTSAVVPDEYHMTQCFTLLVSTLSDDQHPPFYSYFLNSDPAEQMFELEGWGTAQTNISVPILENLTVPKPSVEEQHSIADYLNRTTAEISDLIDKIEEGIDRLKEYRTALISAAVTGQIDVREEVPAAPVESNISE